MRNSLNHGQSWNSLVDGFGFMNVITYVPAPPPKTPSHTLPSSDELKRAWNPYIPLLKIRPCNDTRMT